MGTLTTPAADFDVIVSGGGPAGASAALGLARAGWRVALLDRARFPRDKACGEFLTPQARHCLDALGVWNALSIPDVRAVRATLMCAPNGAQARHIPRDGGPVGYAVRRAVLDGQLLARARQSGVEVQEGFAVRDVRRDESDGTMYVRGTEAEGEPRTLTARLVIGADGSHSLVARQFGLVRALPRLQRVAVVTHWHHVGGANDTIEMRASGQTVCGLGFPGDTANLTLVVPTSRASRIAGRAGDFVDETLTTQFPDLAERLRGATREKPVRTVGCFGHVSRSTVANGVLLVGDAATFIDPFTGEGVYFALRGSELAVQAAHNALRAGDCSAKRLAAYHHARRELRQRYLLCDIVQTVARTPALLNQAVQRLERHPDVAERLLGVLSDTRPPHAVLHPLMLWRLVAPEPLAL